MNSRFFATYPLDYRFGIATQLPFAGGGFSWLLFDYDTRRVIVVEIGKSLAEKGEDIIFKAIAGFIDHLPRDVVNAELSDTGKLLSTSTEHYEDWYNVPFYCRRTDFPRRMNTVRRSDLTEIGRLGLKVDLTTYIPSPGQPAKKVVFKYNFSPSYVAAFWHEMSIVARMPAHPHIVPFDALVVDKMDGIDRVVGFTTRFIPGGTLDDDIDRVFKLKYLEQLISTVDFLNLQLGIVHGDICPWNLLIDAETDTIQLFDFNLSSKLGITDAPSPDNNYDPDRNDVKFVIYTIYEIITRKFQFRSKFEPHELDESKEMGMSVWKKHLGVKLDRPVEEFRKILGEWYKRRKEIGKTVDHFSKAARPLEWPELEPEEELISGGAGRQVLGKARSWFVAQGKEYIRWERPSTEVMKTLKAGQRLLATGEIVDDVGANSGNMPRRR